MNVVICVYERSATMTSNSMINQMLESLQLQLKEELEDYREINIAFVFYVCDLSATKFRRLEKDSRICYRQLGAENENRSAANMWMMGMALLEQEENRGTILECKIENRLYMVTDDHPKRDKIRRMFIEKDGKVSIHPRFQHLNFWPVLYKTEDVEWDILEKYVDQHGHVEPIRRKAFQMPED